MVAFTGVEKGLTRKEFLTQNEFNEVFKTGWFIDLHAQAKFSTQIAFYQVINTVLLLARGIKYESTYSRMYVISLPKDNLIKKHSDILLMYILDVNYYIND